MEGTFPGGVILAIASATGIGVSCICHSIKFIGVVAKEGDPLGMHISIVGQGGCIDVEKGDGHAFLRDLEGDDFHSLNDGVQDIFCSEVGVRSVMVLIDKVFKRRGFVSHDCRHEGRCHFRDRGIIIIKECVFESHDVVGDEMAFGNNEKNGLWGCPAVPELKQAFLGAHYPPNIVGGDGPVFSVFGMIDVRNDHIEVGSIERVMKHVAESDNFGWVNGTIVGQREGDDTWALLLLPELDGGGIKVGTNGLVAMALDVREPSFWPWYKLIFCRWGEVLDGVWRLDFTGNGDARGGWDSGL